MVNGEHRKRLTIDTESIKQGDCVSSKTLQTRTGSLNIDKWSQNYIPCFCYIQMYVLMWKQ